MKNKICVVTFYKHNYGAFLQAYALQSYLIKIGADPVLLDYDYNRDHTIFTVPISDIKEPISFLKSVLYRVLTFSKRRKRDRIFENEAKNKLSQTRYYRHYSQVKKNPPIANIYIVGSDQVWNPFMAKQGLMSRLLEFADENKYVLASYAASMGILYLNGYEKTCFKKHLKRFDYISVREERSVYTLKEITNKDIFVHCDPTLLLDCNEWDVFSSNPLLQKPYLFLYLAQNSPSLIQKALSIAKSLGLVIINCPGSSKYSIECELNRVLSPSEFVGAIKNASYVVTNSFHGLVFTIVYKKKAFVEIPKKGSSRISELISNLSLNRLTIDEFINDSDINNIYCKTDSFLKSKKKETDDYFDLIMESCEKKKHANK